ncbi:MAG: TIM barrel protein [Christensenellales bacterium]|jgi:sugar phosphate isomerase/epimerase
MLDVKFGACEWALPGNGIGSLKLAKEVGLEGLQLPFVSYERGFMLSQKWFRDFYMEESEKYGVALPSMAICEFDLYGLRNPKDSEKGKIVYDIIEKSVEAAIDMKMDMIMMPSFADGFIKTDEELETTAIALQYACDLAKEGNVVIATENLLTRAKNDELFALVGRENFKAFYDSQNYIVNMDWDQLEMLEVMYDLLYPEIHVKDGLNKVYSSTLLGEGDSNFYGTMDFLKKKNYSGWIHLENFYDRLPLRLQNENYIDLLKKDLEILKEACK